MTHRIWSQDFETSKWVCRFGEYVLEVDDYQPARVQIWVYISFLNRKCIREKTTSGPEAGFHLAELWADHHSQVKRLLSVGVAECDLSKWLQASGICRPDPDLIDWCVGVVET